MPKEGGGQVCGLSLGVVSGAVGSTSFVELLSTPAPLIFQGEIGRKNVWRQKCNEFPVHCLISPSDLAAIHLQELLTVLFIFLEGLPALRVDYLPTELSEKDTQGFCYITSLDLTGLECSLIFCISNNFLGDAVYC